MEVYTPGWSFAGVLPGNLLGTPRHLAQSGMFVTTSGSMPISRMSGRSSNASPGRLASSSALKAMLHEMAFGVKPPHCIYARSFAAS